MSFVLLQYPGIVKNIDKALVTLGGLTKLSEDHYKVGAIELDYHRENIYSRSTCSRKRRGTLLIIRARRKKTLSSLPSILTATVPEFTVDVEILGIVKSFYQFNMMFDFQYLPMKRVQQTEGSIDDGADRMVSYESLLPQLVPQTLDGALTWFHPDLSPAKDMDLFLPPFVFSRFSAGSSNLILCRETERQTKPTNPVPLGASLRRDRKSLALMVHGHEMFPMEPPSKLLSEGEAKRSIVDPNNVLQKLFEERPIWLKNALVCLTGLDPLQLKTVLPKHAFYILSGAWGRTWCKYGYEPRTTSDSRCYQTLMFLSKRSRVINVSYRTPQLSKMRSTHEPNTRNAKKPAITESVYKFKSGVLPSYRQTWYQLCDITLPEAKELLEQEPESLPVADNTLGWFKQGALEVVREAMRADVKTTLKRLDREELSEVEGYSTDESVEED